MVGPSGLLTVAAAMLAVTGCKGKSDSERAPADEPAAAANDAATVAAEEHFVPPEVFDDWWKAEPPCPDGAAVRGAAPPDGTAIWCETAGGVKHGAYSSWQEVDGALIKERRGPYADGVGHGVWQSWGANGAKTSVITYKKGERHGMYREFWGEGEKKLDGWYDDGVPHGTWSNFSPTGALIGTTQLEHGTGTMKRYHANGTLEHEYQLRDGEIDGTWTSWDADGNKIAETTYAAGKREGAAARWKDGEEIEGGAYHDDMKSGVWRERDASGRMVERTYERGKVVGGG